MTRKFTFYTIRHFVSFQDKTFGLKNKKGAKNQKFIAQVQNQVQNAGKSAREVCSENKIPIFPTNLFFYLDFKFKKTRKIFNT